MTEKERELIRRAIVEQIHEGIDAARKSGAVVGLPTRIVVTFDD